MELEFGCCFCGEGGEQDSLLALTLFPPDEPHNFEQWWAHAKCIRGAFVPHILGTELREELQAVFDRAGD